MSSPSSLVRFVPLGGLGEIGMNCFALEQDEDILVVDCGVSFPEDDLGVDLLHPDFSWLVAHQERIRGLFITHGHEDHIGGVPFLLRALSRTIPVYAPPHARALLRLRFLEQELDPECLIEVECRKKYEVGSFRVEPIAVAHSIIDATALCIETRAGRILHTGDFDLDPYQPAGQATDEERLRELGEEGVRLLLSDSTNIDTAERQISEEDVEEALLEAVQDAPARVVVSLFASNVHRLLALKGIAQKTGRKLCFLGRSLQRQVEAAREIGRLQYPSLLLLSPEQIASVPPQELLVIAGGTQGETASALRRLSLDTHQSLRLEAGDRVILSSRIIPGNERTVFTMINDLLRLGVEVRHRPTDPFIHTSGHAARNEQRQMMEWVRPRGFVPVHGTLHHLRRHAELAREVGIDDVQVIENGSIIEVEAEAPLRRSQQTVRAGLVRITQGGAELSGEVRRRRQDLARNGLVSVAWGYDTRGQLAVEPSVDAVGVPLFEEEPSWPRILSREVMATLQEYRSRSPASREEQVRRAVRRWMWERGCGRPVVVAHSFVMKAGANK